MHDQAAHFASRRSTDLTDHERTLLCSVISNTFGTCDRLPEATKNELRSLGTRLSCSPEWRAVFAA